MRSLNFRPLVRCASAALALAGATVAFKAGRQVVVATLPALAKK